MWKRIIVYIVILIILLGLYFLFTPQSLKTPSEKSLSQEIPENSSGFKGPNGFPLIKGPNSPIPEYQGN